MSILKNKLKKAVLQSLTQLPYSQLF